MKTVKILHCGDLHFDTPFHGVSVTEGEKRKEDLRETFGRMIELVKEREIPILLMSGDLFDNASVMKTTLEYMMKKFLEIPHTRVFIAPGNHDPYSPKSFYTMMKWPQNVHIFGRQITKVTIPQWHTCVYGVGFSNHHERQSLLHGFCVEDDTTINLMVLHGEVTGEGQSSDYNPITLEDIRNSRLDYLALGHRHSFSGIQREKKTFWAYSGNPEGRGFHELGPKGVILGEVGKGYNNLYFMEIGKRKYNENRIDISGATTYEEIVEKIHAQVQDVDKRKNLYRIILTGTIPEGFSIHTAVLEEKLINDFYFIKVIDDTRVFVDFAVLEKEFTLKGIFVRKIRERLAKATDVKEKKRLEQALKIGIHVLDEGEVRME